MEDEDNKTQIYPSGAYGAFTVTFGEHQIACDFNDIINDYTSYAKINLPVTMAIDTRDFFFSFCNFPDKREALLSDLRSETVKLKSFDEFWDKQYMSLIEMAKNGYSDGDISKRIVAVKIFSE